MTAYTITAAQRDSVLASRLQHLDRGDGGAATALDWAPALQPAAGALEREPLTDEQCDALIEQHVALMPAVDSLRFRGAVTLGELRALVRAVRPTAAVAGSAVSSMPGPIGEATRAAARAEANQSPQDFARGAQWEARRAAARPPEEAKDAVTEDGFPVLCKAWGETDLPAALIAYTRADVRKFMVDQWLGEDGEEADARMADFDDPAEWEDLGDEIVWRFEIGGISFSRCYEADRSVLSQRGGA